MKIPLGVYGQFLRQYLVSQRLIVLVMAALLLSSIGLQLIAPWIVSAFIDAAQRSASQELLIRWALWFIAITGIQQVAQVLATYTSERVAWTATNALR